MFDSEMLLPLSALRVHTSRFKALRSPATKKPFEFVDSSLPQTYVTLEAFFFFFLILTHLPWNT